MSRWKCVHGRGGSGVDCFECPDVRSAQVPRLKQLPREEEPVPKSFPATSTIFTNLDDVLVNGLRLNCKAIVISDDPDLHEGEHRRYAIAGYGSSCVWKVFDMHLRDSEFVWEPKTIEKGQEGQIRRGVLGVHPLPRVPGTTAHTTLGLELIATYPGTRDLGIQVTKIEGSWTPGQRGETDWTQHCERVGAHVFDSAMKAVEATAEPGLTPINALVAVAMQPDVARGLLDDNGLMFRKKA